jgi:glycosyltransferase involved in cell wall biosynthesis
MWPFTVLAPVAAKLAGYSRPVIATEHSVLSKQYQNYGYLHRFFLRMSMAIGYRQVAARVAVSRGVADDLAVLSGVKRLNFTTIYNPIFSNHDVAGKDLKSVNALWGNVSGYRIVSVGRFKAEKNHSLLLVAFANLGTVDAYLMLVGEGPLQATLETQAEALGIRNRVIFAGFQRDPVPFYMTADLFVLASNYEGFGNVIVEALSCGIPVVSTDCPAGPAEILNNGEFGTLVPVNDAPSLTEAMRLALSSPHDAEKLKRRAKDFTPEISAKKYIDLIEKLTKSS